MKIFTKLGIVAALATALPAFAVEYSVVGLGFEGLQVQELSRYNPAQVWEFYSGGYSRTESGLTDLVLGPVDYAVPFSSAALALMSANSGGTGNFGPRYLDVQGGAPLPDAGISALFFTGASPVLNYSKGFNAGFSFYYASTAPITVELFDGVDASGSSLGSANFNPTPTCTLDDNSYCAWSIGAVAFVGTARSARLDGLGNQALFDNVTFGSLSPMDGAIPVPEPASYALMALGLTGLAWVARRRRSLL